jgi:toxin ParE1/3/4
MNNIVLTPKAKVDLSEIWDYTLSQWGSEQAEKYVRELWSAIQAQVNNHYFATDISYLRRGYLKIRSGSHVVFFKVTGSEIVVVRILHQTMDFDRHL